MDSVQVLEEVLETVLEPLLDAVPTPAATHARQVRLPRFRVRATRNPAPDRQTPVWLFDLDNTLHDASHAIFGRMDISMTAAVVDTLQLSEEEAHVLRKKYWQRYGATMIGMVRHHGVSAAEFLHRSHDFDIAPLLRAEKGLANALARLPGRKVLLTNAPLAYATTILRLLGILHCFSSLWAVEHMRIHGTFRVKPSPALMRHVLAREGVQASRAVLVEDTLPNLRGARQVGIRTVFVRHPGTPFSSGQRGRPTYVDLQVNSIRHLLLQRRVLRRP
ncbi:pyrimidine 5'-nucleotidase [Pigmentiphaga aceris]|uniref:Pyrimidine 5'-nucleotidase n=2 Tax=Pigmentiphaga aceris TaxID=1940612 RepID=A0A5C0B2T4_9BURK|nr:pyrimidine 5'-nucleotidase [Pigmentiphaga aceris]